MDIIILDFTGTVLNWVLTGIGYFILGVLALWGIYEFLHQTFGFFPRKCYKCESVNISFYTCADLGESGFRCKDCGYDTGLVDDDIGC